MARTGLMVALVALLATAVAAPTPTAVSAAEATPVPVVAVAAATIAGVAAATCAPGAYQAAVEASLATIGEYAAVTVDGVRSDADCAIIARFQRRFGIEPAGGQADATTADVARRIAASLSPAQQRRCGAGAGTTACVNLDLQTMWVVRNGVVVLGPTVVRTGFRGHATPAGTFKVNKRTRKEWSNPYRVWLPYWQRFYRGMGFHQTTTYLHNAARGSHGCVNLLNADAVALWGLLRTGTKVRTFGRRAGT